MDPKVLAKSYVVDVLKIIGVDPTMEQIEKLQTLFDEAINFHGIMKLDITMNHDNPKLQYDQTAINEVTRFVNQWIQDNTGIPTIIYMHA